MANIFEGRPLQDETKTAPPDSVPSAPSLVELPFLEEKPKRKVSDCILHIKLITVGLCCLDFKAFKATTAGSAAFSTAPA